MRLRRPCEHDRYEGHTWEVPPYEEADRIVSRDGVEISMRACPGGEFLPEDALVIEKVRDQWPAPHVEVAAAVISKSPFWWNLITESAQADLRKTARRVFDALADQVGQPE